MLKPVKKTKVGKANGDFAVVASRYNTRYVDSMLRAAQVELKRAGAKVQVVRVPGAYEIPVVAAKLTTIHPRPAAIICLGVIYGVKRRTRPTSAKR